MGMRLMDLFFTTMYGSTGFLIQTIYTNSAFIQEPPKSID